MTHSPDCRSRIHGPSRYLLRQPNRSYSFPSHSRQSSSHHCCAAVAVPWRDKTLDVKISLARTSGSLDLGWLGLEAVPPEIFEIPDLEVSGQQFFVFSSPFPHLTREVPFYIRSEYASLLNHKIYFSVYLEVVEGERLPQRGGCVCRELRRRKVHGFKYIPLNSYQY